MSGSRRRIVAAVCVLVAITAGCSRDDGDTATSVSVDEPGVEHVHGLGIDPADGALLVATHFGTFRIEGGNASRVGSTYQDTMGFTVVGPNHFLGSGHPDVQGMQAGQPGLLGLIESTDGGESWDAVSLAGEVDFHALAYAHDRAYGWDATGGRFMVSNDLRSWTPRAAGALSSFAVDPTDEAHVVGASPDGLVGSVDDGATWAPLEGPPLVYMSWHPDSGLWGVDADGGSHRSIDSGATWTSSGRLPGAPQALLATEDAVWAAADDDGRTGIYRSVDEGRSWQLSYRDGD